MNALCEKEVAGGRVVKLFPVVALDSFDASTELSEDMGNEVC
jgi:hypothetical protein